MPRNKKKQAKQPKQPEVQTRQEALELVGLNPPDKIRRLKEMQHELNSTMEDIETNRTQGRELRKRRDTLQKKIGELVDMFDQEEFGYAMP